MDERRVAIGLDLGTSGMKGVAIDCDGRVMARAQCLYPTTRPAPGASEQDPCDWFAATTTVIAELARSCEARSWLGIGLSGMIPTLVIADRAGNAIGPAITWEDARAGAYGAMLTDIVGEQAHYAATGQRLDGRYLVPMYLRRLDAQSGLHTDAKRAATIRSAKDHLFAWLTGDLATDPSTATGFGCYDLAHGRWDMGTLDAGAALAGEPLPNLPPVRASTSFAALGAERATTLRLPTGLPVVLGAADSVLGALGLGVERAGDVAYVAGTSNVIIAVADEIRLDADRRCLVTPLALDGSFGVELDILATGSSLAWLTRMFAMTDAAACAELAAPVAVDEAPLFLPYLGGGEQGALWDPTLRGALVGLELHHEPRHVVRGLLNGIILESRRCLAVLEDLGLSCRTIHVAGGSASSAAFRTGLADATSRPVHVADDGDGDVDFSAIGAARLVHVALGTAGCHDSGAAERAEGRAVVEPDPAAAATWDALAASYDELLSAIRPTFAERQRPHTG